MKAFRWVRQAAVVTMICSSVVRAEPPSPSAMDSLAREVAARTDRYNAMPDTSGTGPYPAMMTTDRAFPGFVVYRPRDLAPFGGKRKLAILAWGNGGCSADGASARLELQNIASYGYLVLAPGSVRSGPSVPAHRPEVFPKGAILPSETRQTILLTALDLAFAAAHDHAALDGRIDTMRVAVAGHSCGGLQALTAAVDPRVKTVIIQNSGIFPAGVHAIQNISLDKSMLDRLHTPILYLLGGPRDIAYSNGMDDFSRIDRVPAVAANLDVGHLGTFAQPEGGAVAAVAISWLQWQLRGDLKAGSMFTGRECGLCRDSAWRIDRKGVR